MNSTLHICLILSIAIGTLRVSDIFISPKQHKFVQEKMTALAFYLVGLNPIKTIKYVFTNSFITIALIIFYLILFVLQPSIAKWLFVVELNPILISSAVILMAFAFKNSLPFGKESRKWILYRISNTNENLLEIFYKSLAIVLIKLLISALFFFIISSIVGYAEIKFLFIDENIIFHSMFYGLLTATPFLFELLIFSMLGILILFSIISIVLMNGFVKALNWFVWKIALYKKEQGALTALIMILVFIFSLIEITIKYND